MKKMLGIWYNEDYNMFTIYDLTFCDCGNHVCKSLLRADTKEGILNSLSKAMENLKPLLSQPSAEGIIIADKSKSAKIDITENIVAD